MKNYYEDTIINKRADILCGVFIILVILSLVISVKEYIEGHFDWLILTLILLILLPMLFSLLYIMLANIINGKKNQELAKEIKKNGIKVSGEIVEIINTSKFDYKKSMFKRASFFRKFNQRLAEDRVISNYYYAVIKYSYANKEFKIETPSLNFFPTFLKGNNVDVYIYNDKCYIDNYEVDDKYLKYNQHPY